VAILPSAAQPIMREIPPEDLDRRLAERGLPLSVFGMDKPILELEAVTNPAASRSMAMPMMTQVARLAHDDAVGSVALRGRHRHNHGARAKRHSDIADAGAVSIAAERGRHRAQAPGAKLIEGREDDAAA
jgi:hypothetical protein